MNLHKHIRAFCAGLGVLIFAAILQWQPSELIQVLLAPAMVGLLTYGFWNVTLNSASIKPEDIEEAVVFERWFVPSFMLLMFICLHYVLDGDSPPQWSLGMMMLLYAGLIFWNTKNADKQRQMKLKARQLRGQFWLAAIVLRLIRR